MILERGAGRAVAVRVGLKLLRLGGEVRPCLDQLLVGLGQPVDQQRQGDIVLATEELGGGRLGAYLDREGEAQNQDRDREDDQVAAGKAEVSQHWRTCW